jgi:predicted dinucleotide-binding enzyme
MGRGFAEALAPAHEVVVDSRDPERAGSVASKVDVAAGASYADAVADADVVVLTVPWSAMDETLEQLGDLQGTVVVDVSYPYNQREREALKGRSTAEVIQDRLPNAKVFKGLEPRPHEAPHGTPGRRDRGLRPARRRRSAGQGHRLRAGTGHGIPPGRRRPAEGDA